MRFSRMCATGLFCLLLVVSAVSVYGLDGEPLGVYAGVTVFNDPALDSVSMVQFSFSLNRHQLEFFVADTASRELYARVFAELKLFDTSAVAVDSAQTYFSVRVGDASEAAEQDNMIFNTLTLLIAPGTYSARLAVIDVASKKSGEYFIDRVVVDSLNRTSLQIGGTMPAFSVSYLGEQTDAGNSRLVHNGYLVIPNPTSIFNSSDTAIFLYGELYNLGYNPESPSDFRVSYAAARGDGSPFHFFGERTVTMPGSTAVFAEILDIQGWSAGSYQLQIVAEDIAVGSVDTASVPFWLVDPQALQLAVEEEAARVDPYDQLPLKYKVNLAKQLLGEEQRLLLSRLNAAGKETFLQQFWREMDDLPHTPEIEVRLLTLERFEYANQFFSDNDARDNGWQSDRGRILMTMGFADEIDRRQTPRTGNPYEIWYFRSIQEGWIYVFEDWTGTDEYRLVHSTADGEVFNREWETRLREGFSDFD
jgi:GWxTD domain-containing protein